MGGGEGASRAAFPTRGLGGALWTSWWGCPTDACRLGATQTGQGVRQPQNGTAGVGGRTTGSALRGPKGWSAAGRTGASEPFKPGGVPHRDSGVRPSPLRPPPENPLWRACLFLPPPTSQRRLMRQRAGGISPKTLLLPGASGDIFNFVWFLLFPRITVAGADGGESGRVDGEGGGPVRPWVLRLPSSVLCAAERLLEGGSCG